MGLKRLGGEPPKKKKSVAKRAKVTKPERSDQTLSAPAPADDQAVAPSSPSSRVRSQVHRLAPNEASPGDEAFDANAPYGKNIPAVDESVLPQVLAKKMHHVTEELNPARSTQVSAGVPVHESVKIALGTLLSVSFPEVDFAFTFSLFLRSRLTFYPFGFRSPLNCSLRPVGLTWLWKSSQRPTIAS